MIWLFVILLAVVVVVLQRTSAQRALERLRYSFTADTVMAEPDQLFTVDAVVENRSRLPAMYLRTATYLPTSARLTEDAQWLEENVKKRPNHICVEQTGYLLPRRRRVCRLHMSLPERGWYPMGGATVFAGDFLGLKEVYRTEEAPYEVVVIPDKIRTPEVLQKLGGFLGDVSVRRFIMEDPVLTVGFREYTGREPMKSIAWTQTARTGRMMVKQYDYTTEWNVTVLLNIQGGTREQIEQCYRLTRTVCEELEQRSVPFSFASNADLVGPMGFLGNVAEGLGRQHLNTILYALGRSRCLCRMSWQRLGERAMRAGHMGRSYILITPPLNAAGLVLAERLKAQGGLCLLVGQEAEE